MLELAREQAGKLIDADPELTAHPLLNEKVDAFWKNRENGDAS